MCYEIARLRDSQLDIRVILNQVARELVDEAKAALEPYGERAAPLLGLADYIISRSN